MRRLLALTLVLLAAFTASAQQEPPAPRFVIDNVQISPDGRFGSFYIVAPEDVDVEGTPIGELYAIDLQSGEVFALALQPNQQGTTSHYGEAAFFPDSSGIAWGYLIAHTSPTSWRPEAGLAWMMFETRTVKTAPEVLKFGQSDSLYVPSLMTGHQNSEVISEYWLEGSWLTRYHVVENTLETFFIEPSLGYPYATPYAWVEHYGQFLLAFELNDGRWDYYDFNAQVIVTAESRPFATADSQVIYAEGVGSSVKAYDNSLFVLPEQLDPTLRELTNADAAESVRAALEAALIAEFSETGFSLHPGMTAIFDEFQIYDVLGVEREDTLIVPLEWRLVQPPEGESRPLDVEGPIPFPTQENVGRG